MKKKTETALVNQGALAKFDLSEDAIAKRLELEEAVIAGLSEKYMAIVVKDVNDKEGFEAAHAARMEIKNLRVKITKGAKDLRDDANKYSKLVIKVENRLVNKLTPIEEHLQAQEDIINNEKARLKAEEEQKEAVRIQARIDRLYAIGCVSAAGYIGLSFDHDNAVPEAIAKTVPDEEFEQLIKDFEGKIAAETLRIDQERINKEAEDKRQAQLREDQEAERIRLEGIAEEQRQKEAKLKADQDALDAEKKRMADEKLQGRKDKLYDLGLSVVRDVLVLPFTSECSIAVETLLDVPEEEFRECLKKIDELNAAEKIRAEEERVRLQKEADERALKEAQEKLQRESDEKAEADRLEKEEEARIEAMKPDKEKALNFLKSIKEYTKNNEPTINDETVAAIMAGAEQAIDIAIREAIKKMEELSCKKQLKKGKK